MKEASATRLTSTYFGGNSTVLGAVGGAESQTLTAGQLPANIPNSAVTAITGGTIGGTTSTGNGGTGSGLTIPVGAVSIVAGTTVTINASGGAAHPIVQPTIILNKLLRII
jgi:microcystin-dependent protein